MAILDLIQQGTEAAKRYAQLGSPVLNFAKGLTTGPSKAYISDTMRDQLVQKAKETELDKGSLGYEAFGLPVGAEGGRFTGGLFDLAIKDPVAFGNVGSVGRVSFEKDSTEPGGYKFGDIEYNFTPDKDTGSTGNVLLDFINRGGFQSTPVGQSIYDLGGKIADLNLGFTSAAAAEPPSGQRYNEQLPTGAMDRETPFGDKLRPQIPEADSLGPFSNREFGNIRAGQPELGIFGVPKVQDLPVDFSELDDLEAQDAEAAALIEQALQEERRANLDKLKSFGKDVTGRVILSNILKGVGTAVGGPVVGTAAGITGLVGGGGNIFNSASQRTFDAMTPGQQSFTSNLYQPGGLLQGYNQVSAFGQGALGTLSDRLDTVRGTLAKQARQGRTSKILQQREKDLSQAIRDTINIGEQEALKDPTRSITTPSGNRIRTDVEMSEGAESPGGGGKIVCTMMNESYGFGNFRNKIWLRQSKDLAPEYQKGYHILFLPLVKMAKTNKIIKKLLEHIAVHRTIDIRQESRGKTHILGRLYRKVLEPICYWVGKYAKR